MSDARKRLQGLGEKSRALGIYPPPEMCDPATVDAGGRAFLDGWLGDTWRFRLYRTNFCRVLILPDRLAVIPDRREDLFARSAA